MKTLALCLAALLPLAAPAADLQDWSTLDPGINAGAYADDAGGKASIARTDGPAAGQKAVQLKADVVKWGGLWASLGSLDLSKAAGLRFKAKAAPAGYLLVSLTDAKKTQVEATVRVMEGDWQEFTLPLSHFKRSSWQQPEAPKDGVFDPSKVTTLNLSPRATGKSEFTVGPIAILTGKAEARTGMMDGSGKDGAMMAQDFESLDAGAYGTFADEKGSSIKVAVVGAPGAKAGELRYDLKEGGWGGVWMRAGDAWGGQDWSGAKRITLKVDSAVPVAIELAFNDLNQNAYLCEPMQHAGKGVQELSVPLSAFKLNEWYQPPQAKKGAALDLSRIETFNISSKTPGKYAFKVDDVKVFKK